MYISKRFDHHYTSTTRKASASTTTTTYSIAYCCMLLFILQSSNCKSFTLTRTTSTFPSLYSNLLPGVLQQQQQRKGLFSQMTLLDQQQPTDDNSTTETLLSTKTPKIPSKAKRIPSTSESLVKAGERLRAGNLVSFPTETVYGLGCHALDPNAVKKVFEAKERPLSDPLIVHVNSGESALNLWDASSSSSSNDVDDDNDSARNTQKKTLLALVDHFWPGPLTIVAKASPKVPSIIMANTGFVACRSPSHPIARALIDTSEVPIAAPSANKFGHVSPTKASHVFDDLGMEDVWIVDPSLNTSSSSSSASNDKVVTDEIVCDVGVESTVAKVEFHNNEEGVITVLRHGAISSQDIRKCLQNVGLDGKLTVQSKQQATGDDVHHVAPGQTIRHYSPNVPSYMVSHERYNGEKTLSDEEASIVKNAVIIDFGGRLEYWKGMALAYRDLSPSGNSDVAASKVFDTLRWSESIDGAKRVFFPELNVESNVDDALVLAVKDRLTRAASGVVISTFI